MLCKRCSVSHAPHELINELCHRCTASELKYIESLIVSTLARSCAMSDEAPPAQILIKAKALLSAIPTAMAMTRKIQNKYDVMYEQAKDLADTIDAAVNVEPQSAGPIARLATQIEGLLGAYINEKTKSPN